MIQMIRLKRIGIVGLLIFFIGLAKANEKDRTEEYLHNAGIAIVCQSQKAMHTKRVLRKVGIFKEGIIAPRHKS